MNPMNTPTASPTEETPKNVIVAGTKVNATINSDQDVEIAGIFEGSIQCRTLEVKEGGTVKGDVDAETVKVAGEIIGEVTANNVMAAPTSKLEGKFVAINFGIEMGASVRGAHFDSPHDQLETNVAGRQHPRIVKPYTAATENNTETAKA